MSDRYISSPRRCHVAAFASTQWYSLLALCALVSDVSAAGESCENQGILELQLLETELDKAAMDKLTSFTDMSSKMYCLIEVLCCDNNCVVTGGAV